MVKITAAEAAKRIGISAEDLKMLEQQGIIHASHGQEGENLYISSEIDEIKSRQGQTIADEAQKTDAEIQRNSVSTISVLRKVLISAGIVIGGYSTFVGIFVILFTFYPLQTSDFLGYYYRFNYVEPQQASSIKGERVLQAATGPNILAEQTSILADVLKPAAAVSLVLVKAFDSNKYALVVTNPVPSFPETGIDIIERAFGADGADGLQGLPGPLGQTGPAGAAGKDGTSTSGISGLTNNNLSGDAGITNDNLANPTLTIASGDGLIGGGVVSLGGSIVLEMNLATSGVTGLASSSSGLEFLDSGLTLLHGCADGEILKWTDAGEAWTCASDLNGSDLQQSVSYDTSQDLVNVTASQSILTTVSVTPLTNSGDVYVTGQAEVFSGSAIDQVLNLVIETSDNCTGAVVGNASIDYSITSGASNSIMRGVLIISGVDLNPGTSAQSYSLCASTATGDTSIQNWRLEALVID